MKRIAPLNQKKSCTHFRLGITALVFFFMLLQQGSLWAASNSLDIKPGAGVSGKKMISDYLTTLKDTLFDTPVFILDSGKPGANVLVVGGTHGNELAGYASALMLVEKAKVKTGKLVVIPVANRSAMFTADMISYVGPTLNVQSPSGTRTFRYGNRFSDREHINRPNSGFISKAEKATLNLNRVFPGKSDGIETEQLALAIINLIREEKIDMNIDFHEARTPKKKRSHGRKYQLAYSVIAHPRGTEIAAYALLAFEEATELPIKLEESKPEHVGFSHWEIGSRTQSISFLSETPNPGQDRWRRKPDVINDAQYPLKHRVGVHIWLFYSLAEAFADIEDKPFSIEGLPSYQELMKQDLGSFLN